MFYDNFGVVGGDKRQIAMMKSLAEDGASVHAVGFEHTSDKFRFNKSSLQETIRSSQYIILPLPVTKDGITLNSPYSEKKIILDDEFAQTLSGKLVFCGILEKLFETSKIWNKIDVYDYSSREEFAVRNAVPTAEGAIEIAMRAYSGTINGSSCLVAGFGRIGKILCSMLTGLGAHVTASARKTHDLAWIESCNYKAVLTYEICNTSGYDIIFNTVPNLTFDAYTLAKAAEDTLVIDLASSPGGVDFEAAARLGIKTIQALSLPGKVAPKAAGEIIKTTIYNIIEQNRL